MKKVIAILACLMCMQATAQVDSQGMRRSRHPIRNGVWILPSGAEKINGLALGIATVNVYKRPLEIKGMNIDLFPIGVITGMMYCLYLPVLTFAPESAPGAARGSFYQIDTINRNVEQKTVKGLDVRATGTFSSNLYGVGISGVLSVLNIQRGVVLSGGCNISEDFEGVQIATWANKSTTGKGIQIGLFNQCADCKGLQIGLINRNGHSLQPLINWRRPHPISYKTSAGKLEG